MNDISTFSRSSFKSISAESDVVDAIGDGEGEVDGRFVFGDGDCVGSVEVICTGSNVG